MHPTQNHLGATKNLRFSIIVPSLNEGKYIGDLLRSLSIQTFTDYEVIVVDGGSSDDTLRVAQQFNSRIYMENGMREFASRNLGAKVSNGSIIIFTCADVIFPKDLLERINLLFDQNTTLAAITCEGIPHDGSENLRLEYSIYNVVRRWSSVLPQPFKRFSTSTNFLAVKREVFDRIGGFLSDDINADGKLGMKLVKGYQTKFDTESYVYISARRMKNWGIAKFTFHYSYVLENFIPGLSKYRWFKDMKTRSFHKHSDIHKIDKQATV